MSLFSSLLHKVFKIFGPLFVVLICLLITLIVAMVYVIGIPYWWQRSPLALVIFLSIGHWLLVNIVFHYTMAAITSPGHLPIGALIPEAVDFCKKCLAPKPPRTHHCAVCNRCILKMDHHCPWLNNCIGHFNHRYFFMFLAYTVCGLLFLMVFGCGIVYEHLSIQKGFFKHNYNSSLLNFLNPDPAFLLWIKRTNSYHNILMYLTFVSIGSVISLEGLTLWHAYLITKGQTSIEYLIYKVDGLGARKRKTTIINPYDFGPMENWKLFLGLQDGRNWRHIVLPSTHKPIGTGLQWRTATRRKQNV